MPLVKMDKCQISVHAPEYDPDIYEQVKTSS